ncbi:uncharacterized protein LOC131208143 [Anopheles bellator]|uniref:uncharacterized protein LOC131208143 n=1 Tax=Anopheles bellator TaxID=139047 RepID=UPI00264A0C5A|nr:uncharacterized protein LOC131208143 [Anopheles bellator]
MKKNFLAILLLLATALARRSSAEVTGGPPKGYPINRGRPIAFGAAEHVVTSHSFDTKNPDPWASKQYKEVTITHNVPVPYPVKVERHVAVPVRIPLPIAVQSKVPIVVERKVPVYVDKPIPVQVDRPVPYALPVEIPVFHRVAVEVPKPYPVHVPQPYPVYIKKPIFVKQRGSSVGSNPKPAAHRSRVRKSPPTRVSITKVTQA